jgi:superfamily II DNA or RNA helicase
LQLRDYQQPIADATLDAFRRGFKRPLVTLPCGAGKTVLFAYMAQRSQNKGKTVWFLVHRKELMDQTVETFKRFDIPLNTIYIGMVATFANHLDAYPTPDFIIFDEAHFSAAATWRKIIDRFPNAYICGLTATPCRLDGKPLSDIYDTLISGVTARELISDGYLSEYKYFAPSVADLSGLKRRGKDYDTEQAAELLSTRAVFGDVIQHYQKYADGLQTICYCSSIQHSESMAQEFRAAGINAVHFDGNTQAKERAEIIRRFRKGEIKILRNVDLISCGFDVPDCWCCILLRPTASTALYIQQSMRALRPALFKTAVILDHVNNYERHGLPDADREWTLDGTLKQPKQYGDDGKLIVRQCTNCFYTYSGSSVCPNCGFKNDLTRQEIKNMKEIHLEEIKENYRNNAADAVREKTDISECRNLSEIMAWCKQNGKKPGYGYYFAKSIGLIRTKNGG